MRTAKRVGTGMMAAIALACGPTAPDGSRSGLASSGQDLKQTGMEEKVTGEGQFVHPDFGTVTCCHLLRGGPGEPPGLDRWGAHQQQRSGPGYRGG